MKKIKTIYSLVTLFIALLFSNNLSAQCTHTFNGYDSFGDGWNGATCTITVNGAPVGVCTVPTGTTEAIQFQASDGDLIKLDWVSGGYDYEISWDVTDGGNNVIAMGLFGTTAVGSGACPPPTPCATLDYLQDFELGTTNMLATTQSQSDAYLDAISANGSLYGLHMQGNTSTGWGTPYTTGPDAFNSSPTHIASVTREICASIDPTLTLTFDKMQTYTWNVTYCWFRLTVDGIPVADDNGNIYFNGSNNMWEPMKYDLSSYAGMDFTVAWESCAKYYTGYTTTGMGGDAVYIDNVILNQTSGLSPPSTPGAISGFDLPNAGGTETYTIDPVSGATSYTWTVPLGYNILVDNGTSITVTTSSTDGNIAVYASNAAGNSSPQSLTITTAEIVTSYPYTTAFESETNDVTTASETGFTFNEAGWRNVPGDDGDWRTDAGGTGSTNSGPGGGATSGVSDHSPGTSAGKYIYTEASTPMYPSKTFELWSPPYDLTSLNVPTLTFWYSMYSITGASLALQTSTDNGTTWSSEIPFMCPTVHTEAIVNIDMGNNWRQGFVDLAPYGNLSNVMFRFKVTTGTSWDSDICLDDIKVVDAQNTSVDVGENISLYANSYSMAYGLVLNGIAEQNVTSNGYNISNLEIDNTNGVTISGELKIDGILTLTDGVITTSTDRVTTAAIPTGAISGGSNTSFIYGNLRRYIASNGTYVFPIGSGIATTDYQRIDLTNSSLTGVNYIDASVGTMGNGNNLQLNTSQLGSSIAEMLNKEWKLTPDATPSGGSYGVDLYLNGLSGSILQDGNFTVLKRPSNSITYTDWDTYEATTTIPDNGLPGRTISDGYAKKSGFSSFSGFGVGGTGGGALPIDLISFTANVIDENVRVNWTVASQVNNEYFTIHRSNDVENWIEVGRMDGAGNTNQTMEYVLYDDEPLNGTSYYRLTQTDFNGDSEVFFPISVTFVQPLIFSINPNPVDDVLFLYLEETRDGQTDIVIYNTSGKQVYRKAFFGNFTILKLRVKDLKTGYYILTVTQDKNSGKLKFVKE